MISGTWVECSCQRANREPTDATLKESAPDLTRPGDMRSDVAYPSERLMVAPAIQAVQAVRDVLDGLEDWEIQDHALEEIRSAVDDIPDCESATAIPHEEHGEPSDAYVKADVWDEGAEMGHRLYAEPMHVIEARNPYRNAQ